MYDSSSGISVPYLDVTGTTTLLGYVGIGKTYSSSYALDVSGNVHISGDLSCNNIYTFGLATLNRGLDVSGNVLINTTKSSSYALDVYGNTNLDGSLNVTGNTYLYKLLDVSGNTKLHGSLDVSGDLSCNNIYTSGNVNVSGDVSCNKITAAGLATLNKGLTVTGTVSTQLQSGLTVSGTTQLQSGLTVTGGNTSLTTLYTSGLATLNSITTDRNGVVNMGYYAYSGLSNLPSFSVTTENVRIAGWLYNCGTGNAEYETGSNQFPSPPSTAFYGAIGANFDANREINFWNTDVSYNYGNIGWSFLATNTPNGDTSGSTNANTTRCMKLDRAGNAILNGSLSFTTTDTSVGQNTSNTSVGYYSTAIGYGTLLYNKTKTQNTAVGMIALGGSNPIGNNNTAIGYGAGNFSTTGTLGEGNTFIGYGSSYDFSGGTIDQSTAIGYRAIVTASNQIMLGTTAENVVCPGNISLPSVSGFIDQGNIYYGDNSTGFMRQFCYANICYMYYYGNFKFASVNSPNSSSGGTETFTIDSVGNATVLGTMTAVSFNASSDYRIKENVLSLDETYIIDKLNPVTYMNLKSGKQDIGLIAHELQEVYPELVTGTKDGEDMQSVNYIGLIAILIKEIQELKRREKLTSDILARIGNIIN